MNTEIFANFPYFCIMNTIMRFSRYILCGIAMLGLASCGSDEPGPDPVPSKAPRTVLTYIIATNNLGSSGFDSEDLDEMMQAAANGALKGGARWLVYHAPSDDSAPRLLELMPDGFKELATYEPGSSATGARMDAVMKDMERLAPASSYGLVLWSHATGWLQDGIDDPEYSTKSFGSDFGKHMNVTTLRGVLARHDFDYVYFDACYMATVEVAYELRGVTRHIVGSPSELPVRGMPYHENVPLLLNGSAANLVKAAGNTFAYYNSLPNADERTCTMAVIATSALDRLAAATRDIYSVTPLPHPGTNVTNYRGTSRQGYSIDFGEYVRALAAGATDATTLLGAFDKAMNDAVIYCDATDKLWDRWPIYSTSGLATYVFNDASDFDIKGYTSLQWARDVVQQHVDNNTLQ